MIILDLSANTHRNDKYYYKKIIDEIYKHHPWELIIKNQLFESAGDNVVQDLDMFKEMAIWTYKNYGYKTTASVFDKPSLRFLQETVLPYELPFIKIANNKALHYLIPEIRYRLAISYTETLFGLPEDTIELCCISKYPANIEDYCVFSKEQLENGISDHTVGMELHDTYGTKYWEKHIKLKDSTGLDSGDFAITPDLLRRQS